MMNPINRVFIMIFLAVVLLATAGCDRVSMQKDSQVEIPTEYSRELDALLPEIPATWTYMGIGEYGSVMSLGEVVEMASQKIYKVYGEVEDLTGGELNNEAFVFSITYVVYEDRIEQIKTGQMLLDSDYDRITLIKAPLEAGTTWTESVEDADGRAVKLIGTITEVSKDNDTGPIYTVSYTVEGSDYFEKRMIKEGEGVISFEKPFFYDGESFPVQYGLSSLNREQTLIVKDRDESELSAVKTDDDATLIELDVLPEQDSAHQPDEEEAAQLEALIYDFNEAWTYFANEKNMGILDFVTASGEANDIIHRFPAGTMVLSFETIDITDIRVEGDNANLYVHEIIKKVTEEKTEMLEYFWLYDVRRIDGQWKIHSYMDQRQ